MTKKLLFISIITLVSISISSVSAQSAKAINSEVIAATKTGDAHLLSNSFKAQVELVLPGKTGVYSKAQSEMILKDFFEHNPPSSFTIIHSGKKENASFSIGNYQSNDKHYRMTFLTKDDASKTLIHQLRIEAQDE